MTEDKEKAFQNFIKLNTGNVITTKNGNNGCDFSEFNVTEQRDLFLNKDNEKKWNEIVTNKYHELETEEGIA